MTYKAVVASTMPLNLKIDIRRTAYVLSENAVQTVFEQIQKRLSDGKPVEILLRAPSSTKEDNTAQVIFGSPTLMQNGVVAQIVGAELRKLDSPDVTQVVADIQFKNSDLEHAFESDTVRNAISIFLLLGIPDPVRSLRKVVVSEEEGEISMLESDFIVVGGNLGEKRSSSNPMLTFL